MEQPNDTELMAYADGELSAGRASEIEQIARSDESILRRISQFRQSRAAIFNVLNPLGEEQVPEAIRRAVLDMAEDQSAMDDNVVVLKPRSRTDARPGWQMGIAAAVLLMIGGVAGFLAGAEPGQEAAGGIPVGSLVPQDLAGHIALLPSGTDITIADSRLRLIATVLTDGEVPCREFELDTLPTRQTATGITCHRNGGWMIEIAVVAPASADGFAPASSFSTLDTYLQAIGASDPLDASAEEQALRSAAGRD